MYSSLSAHEPHRADSDEELYKAAGRQVTAHSWWIVSCSTLLLIWLFAPLVPLLNHLSHTLVQRTSNGTTPSNHHATAATLPSEPPLMQSLTQPAPGRRHVINGATPGKHHATATTLPSEPPLVQALTLPAPRRRYVNKYNGMNPLGIQADANRSQNYFLIIGDWGKPYAPGQCQLAVGSLMKSYVRKQARRGKRLLFIGSVGDNFYWMGVRPDSWSVQWEVPYGTSTPTSPLNGVPWLSVLGNHDYGNDDPYAFCPNMTAQAHIDGQAYAAKQFNADRNPLRPWYSRHYWMPDYSYHYVIPEADLEVIALDTNGAAVDALGGEGRGHDLAFQLCRGRERVQSFLHEVAEAGKELLVQRAQAGTARTVVILQHYPQLCERELFEGSVWPGRQVNVLCAYGHLHDQRCDGRDPRGNCNTVLTGGGGGCCKHDMGRNGFTAVHLTGASDGGFVVDVESHDVRLPPGNCTW